MYVHWYLVQVFPCQCVTVNDVVIYSDRKYLRLTSMRLSMKFEGYSDDESSDELLFLISGRTNYIEFEKNDVG